jgi:hypothetical protein
MLKSCSDMVCFFFFSFFAFWPRGCPPIASCGVGSPPACVSFVGSSILQNETTPVGSADGRNLDERGAFITLSIFQEFKRSRS